MLLKATTVAEVEQEVFQLKEGKAPGLDGFTTNVFLFFWETIRDEVWGVVEELRTTHWLLSALNATFITLLSKVDNVAMPSKYRPISLYNVIYKVIYKVISNRLKQHLPLIISPDKIGYVEGRQIIDGIILTHEFILL